MLNIDLHPTFTRIATFRVPSGAGFVEQTAGVTFAALTIDEFTAFDLGVPAELRKFLERVVQGMDDLVDSAGDPVTYTADLRDRIISQDWGRQGLVRAYVEGRSRAGEGN